MKQHITSDNLKQLNTNEFLRLAKMHHSITYRRTEWDDVKLDVAKWFEKDKTNWFAIEDWLTIGKMIEILKEKTFHFQLTCSSVEIYTPIEPEIEFVEEELCDALWEACKYVLEEVDE